MSSSSSSSSSSIIINNNDDNNNNWLAASTHPTGTHTQMGQSIGFDPPNCGWNIRQTGNCPVVGRISSIIYPSWAM